MKWRVVWTKPAERDMRGVGSQTRIRVSRAVDRFAETGQGDARPLVASPAKEWRLRVGDVRVRFRLIPDAGEMVIDRVLPREDAYRLELLTYPGDDPETGQG